ncbi:MAG TPA: hypothetical protein VLF94_08820 [Chlamydiales bacterium]|nr:hypothetical protein [Chlamydiales bacterium]
MRSLHPWPIFPSNLDPPVARSLSIQFILQGLSDSFELLQYLELHVPRQLLGIHLKEELDIISKELQKLLLFSLENPFSQKGSALDKLCFYCDILLQASHVEESEIPMILEELKAPVLKVKLHLTTWKKSPAPLAQMQSELRELFSVLHGKLRRFFAAFSPYLREARSDENVLIYLIENKDNLNSYLGERCIEDMLQRFFPAGHAQLRAAIIEGYTRRGFSTFLSKVEPLIDAIEWETQVCPQLTH